MIIKVILIIFAYLLIGIAVLEGVLWRDRRESFIDRWVDTDDDDVEQVMIVILWPVAIPLLGVYILFIILKSLIKAVRIFLTAIAYLIAAIIDKDREE